MVSARCVAVSSAHGSFRAADDPSRDVASPSLIVASTFVGRARLYCPRRRDICPRRGQHRSTRRYFRRFTRSFRPTRHGLRTARRRFSAARYGFPERRRVFCSSRVGFCHPRHRFRCGFPPSWCRRLRRGRCARHRASRHAKIAGRRPRQRPVRSARRNRRLAQPQSGRRSSNPGREGCVGSPRRTLRGAVRNRTARVRPMRRRRTVSRPRRQGLRRKPENRRQALRDRNVGISPRPRPH